MSRDATCFMTFWFSPVHLVWRDDDTWGAGWHFKYQISSTKCKEAKHEMSTLCKFSVSSTFHCFCRYYYHNVAMLLSVSPLSCKNSKSSSYQMLRGRLRSPSEKNWLSLLYRRYNSSTYTQPIYYLKLSIFTFSSVATIYYLV